MADTELSVRHKQKSDTTYNWERENPILLRSEIGFEICLDSSTKMKIGDGITAWNLLPYFENEIKISPDTDVVDIEDGKLLGVENGKVIAVDMDMLDTNLPIGHRDYMNFSPFLDRVVAPNGIIFLRENGQKIDQNEFPELYQMLASDPTDIIPQMTSNDTPEPYVITASSTNPVNRPFRIFDKVLTSGWSSDSQGNGWVQIYIGEYPSVITSYSLWTGTNGCTLKLQGSTDGIAFDDIHSFDGTRLSSYTFEVNLNIAYKYFRINVIGNVWKDLYELKLFTQGCLPNTVKDANGRAMWIVASNPNKLRITPNTPVADISDGKLLGVEDGKVSGVDVDEKISEALGIINIEPTDVISIVNTLPSAINRRGCGIASDNVYAYLASGITTTVQNTLIRCRLLDITMNAVSPWESIVTYAASASALAAVNGELYQFGGFNTSYVATAKKITFPSTVTDLPDLPLATSCSAQAHEYNGFIYIFTNNLGVVKFNISNSSYITLNDTPGSSWQGYAIRGGNKVFYFSWDWRLITFDMETETFTSVSTYYRPGSIQAFVYIKEIESLLIIGGGGDAVNVSQLGFMDISSGIYAPINNPAPAPRSSAVLLPTIDGDICITGGIYNSTPRGDAEIMRVTPAAFILHKVYTAMFTAPSMADKDVLSTGGSKLNALSAAPLVIPAGSVIPANTEIQIQFPNTSVKILDNIVHDGSWIRKQSTDFSHFVTKVDIGVPDGVAGLDNNQKLFVDNKILAPGIEVVGIPDGYAIGIEDGKLTGIDLSEITVDYFPQASTTQRGIVQLSNDIDSTDETKAATPLALKTSLTNAITTETPSPPFFGEISQVNLWNFVAERILLPGGNWTLRASAADNDWRSVCYGNGLFVAVANSGVGDRVMTSPDGINWTLRKSAADNDWRSVCYGDGLFVAVASDGGTSRVMTSPDGINWTLRTASSTSASDWQSVCYGHSDGRYVAVGNAGTSRAMYSSNGTSWGANTNSSNEYNSVCFHDGLYVAVASTGTLTSRVMTTPNPSNMWNTRTGQNNEWRSVCYGDGLFVAVASSGVGNRVMTSANGMTNWTSRISAADNDWHSVCYNNRLFVAVASSGVGNRVMTSLDGINWTSRKSAADNDWRSVCYGKGLFVAVASSGEGNRVMTSLAPLQFETATEPAFENRMNKATTISGDGRETEFLINHNLNTFDLVVQVKDSATGENIPLGRNMFANNFTVDQDNIKLVFMNPPAIGENYRILTIAAQNS